MEAILSALPQLVSIVEKGGPTGLLLIFCGVLVYEVMRLRKLSGKTFRQRDKARLIGERYKSACVSHGIAVDISDIDAIFKEDAEDEK